VVNLILISFFIHLLDKIVMLLFLLSCTYIFMDFDFTGSDDLT